MLELYTLAQSISQMLLTFTKQDQIKKNPCNQKKAKRQISIGQLKILLLLHPQPIKLLV